jgi:hypothetical protein
MIVTNNVIVSENLLPHHVCDEIVKLARSHQQIEGVVANGLDKTIRDSRIVWLTDMWIYDWITPFITQSNIDLGWNFNIQFPENIQFTTYKKNQFYGWHQDSYNNPTESQRKVSVVIPLCDGSEYSGGDLEFIDPVVSPESKKEKLIQDERFRVKGNGVIFPSYVFHRVNKVTEGERLSIVIWYNGEIWK